VHGRHRPLEFTPTMSALITASNVGHAFHGKAVFSGVNFSIERGDRRAVLGASGSGKSTLLRIIGGLLRPATGRVERVEKLQLGMVFQDLALWPNLTALQNVKFVLQARPRGEQTSAAMEALKQCQISHLADRLPRALSIGEQQRLALARAIAVRPDLLLLDEPFSSLDLVLKSELLEMVGAIGQETAILLVTHDPFEALALCASALVLESGAAVQMGSLRELVKNPSSQLLRAFAETMQVLPRS
jgi:ABC-type Fe3+/spermidine/putrescine transport system ATPase subunit